MNAFEQDRYFSKKKFWKFFGGEVRIFTEDKSTLLFFVKQKAFKLKEDITIYQDESQQQPLLKIQARSIIDFSAAYDVFDITHNQKLGALRRKGFSSLLRDSWQILDTNDHAIGKVTEDSMGMALLRRFVSNLVPQSFQVIQKINSIVVSV